MTKKQPSNEPPHNNEELAQRYLNSVLEGAYVEVPILRAALITLGCTEISKEEVARLKLAKPRFGSYFSHEKVEGMNIILPSGGRITSAKPLEEIKFYLEALKDVGVLKPVSEQAQAGSKTHVEKAEEAGKKPGGMARGGPSTPPKPDKDDKDKHISPELRALMEELEE